jgi:O-methyltransferase involved in polyketide biosynthesis
MNNVNKTLFIPLYGKAYVSRTGILLKDPKAEEIWAKEAFPLKGKAKSKWLAYYMAMRAWVFDRWTEEQLRAAADAVVLHLGCGMDTRVLRVDNGNHMWYDIDFPDVIRQRKEYFTETSRYQMVGTDIRDPQWLEALPEKSTAIVVMEGISMYLQPEELRQVLRDLKGHFETVHLLMDCYSKFAARVSRYKNPINEVGVTRVYGLDQPQKLNHGSFRFTAEMDMVPQRYVRQLQGMEQRIFKTVFAGPIYGMLYRLYEFRSE